MRGCRRLATSAVVRRSLPPVAELVLAPAAARAGVVAARRFGAGGHAARLHAGGRVLATALAARKLLRAGALRRGAVGGRAAAGADDSGYSGLAGADHLRRLPAASL